MTMKTGERQVAPDLSGIRRDHVARYEWAAKRVSGRVLDACCGVGYGTYVLAKAGCKVLGLDADADAVQYAREHYKRRGAGFQRADLATFKPDGAFDAAICFEAIEHLADPKPMLQALRQVTGVLYASVPNEAAFPWNGIPFHHRHYTKAQLERLLGECGWRVTEWWGQRDDESDPAKDLADVRTLIAVCTRGKVLAPRAPVVKPAAPAHVAILGMGPSLHEFINISKGSGGRSALCDEVWAINALGEVIDCDKIFHMDDVRIQEARAAANPTGNIAPMVRWLKTHPGPIITSRAYPDYPGLVEFPLEEVLNDLGIAYFNSTTAYAIAYAIWIGVKRLSLFGLDYTYANAHRAEKGRACVEFWLGVAKQRGIEILLPRTTSLMDGCEREQDRLYGYDTVEVMICRARDRTRLQFSERKAIATAEEIETRYDHTVHPNRLVREGVH